MIPVPTHSPKMGDHLSHGRMPVDEIDRLYMERMEAKEALFDKSRFIGEVDLPERKSMLLMSRAFSLMIAV